MLLRTAAIEACRQRPEAVFVALQPGTYAPALRSVCGGGRRDGSGRFRRRCSSARSTRCRLAARRCSSITAGSGSSGSRVISLRETNRSPASGRRRLLLREQLRQCAQWDPGVAASTKTSPGRVGVGTVFSLRVRFGPRSIPMAYVIRVYEPPSRVALEGTGGSVHALDDIEFAATPRGTRITYAADITLRGTVGRVEPWLKGALDRVGKNAVRGLQAASPTTSRQPDAACSPISRTA